MSLTFLEQPGIGAKETLYKWTDSKSVEHIVKVFPHADCLSLPFFECFVCVVDPEEKATGKRFLSVPLSSLKPLPSHP